MSRLKKILKNKQLGVIVLCGVFIILASTWFVAPNIYRSIVRYQKELARATVPVSLSLEEKKKIEKEILELQNAIRSSNKKGAENYASQYVSLGEKFEQLGYRAKAVKAYQGAVREDGKNVSAYAHLGAVSGDMKNWSAARDAFRMAIDLNPGDADFYYSLAYVYSDGMKDDEIARGVFLEGLVRTGNDKWLIEKYIPFLEKIGEYSEAKLYQRELAKKEQPQTADTKKQPKK